jgi:hypothetical protein
MKLNVFDGQLFTVWGKKIEKTPPTAIQRNTPNSVAQIGSFSFFATRYERYMPSWSSKVNFRKFRI